MSKIHQALQETSASAQRRQQRNFNPLSMTSQAKSGKKASYTAVVLILLSAALLIVFWPEENKPDPITIRSDPPAVVSQPAESIQAEVNPVAEKTTLAFSANTESADKAPKQAEPVTTADPAVEPPLTPAVKPAVVVVESTSEPPVAETAAAKPAVKLAAPENKPESAETVRAETVTKPAPAAPVAITTETTSGITPAAVTEPNAPRQSSRSGTEQSESTVAPANAQTVENDAASAIRKSQAKWQKDIQNHIINGNIRQAEAQLKQWISTLPADPAPRIWLARIYINKGLYQAAEPVLMGLKGSSEAQALLGIIYEKTNRPTLAASTFEQLYRNDPENNRWLLFWAVNTENSRELVIAKTLYQNYLQRFASVDAGLTQFAQSRLQALGGVR